MSQDGTRLGGSNGIGDRGGLLQMRPGEGIKGLCPTGITGQEGSPVRGFLFSVKQQSSQAK